MDWKNKFEYEYPLYQLVWEFFNRALETLWRLSQTNLGCFNRSAFRNVQCLHFFNVLDFKQGREKVLHRFPENLFQSYFAFRVEFREMILRHFLDLSGPWKREVQWLFHRSENWPNEGLENGSFDFSPFTTVLPTRERDPVLFQSCITNRVSFGCQNLAKCSYYLGSGRWAGRNLCPSSPT